MMDCIWFRSIYDWLGNGSRGVTLPMMYILLVGAQLLVTHVAQEPTVLMFIFLVLFQQSDLSKVFITLVTGEALLVMHSVHVCVQFVLGEGGVVTLITGVYHISMLVNTKD